MDITVKMPQLGESVTEGTVSAWLKKPGDRVDQYEPLLEVITDKVNAEVPSPEAGVVKELLVAEGDTVPVGTPICILEGEGSGEAPGDADAAPAAAGDAASASAAGTPAGAQEAAVPAGPATAAAGLSAPAVQAPAPAGPAASTGAPAEPQRGRYSPAVRRLAREHNVDLSLVTGTGSGGRVTRDDVERFIESGGAAAASGKASAAPAASAAVASPGAGTVTMAPAAAGAPAVQGPVAQPGPDDEVVPLTPIRRSIAQNMVLSASTIPVAWSMVEADVTGLERLLSAQGEAFRAREGVALTFLPFAIKAAVEALKAVPRMNASWGGDSIIQHRRIHVGIAVATEAGLVVPVIHDADKLSIAGLAQAIADLASRARAGRLTLDDIQGGTFTVDNTGAVGTELSVPIIVPGQAGIVTTERARKKPVVRGDAIAIRTIMPLCLSMDHRIVDGADAGRFLGAMRARLESFDETAALY